MNRLSNFNSLPPKKEYIDSILTILINNKLMLKDIINKTQLTHTQVRCSLDKLLQEEIVQSQVDEKNRKVYFIKENNE